MREWKESREKLGAFSDLLPCPITAKSSYCYEHSQILPIIRGLPHIDGHISADPVRWVRLVRPSFQGRRSLLPDAHRCLGLQWRFDLFLAPSSSPLISASHLSLPLLNANEQRKVTVSRSMPLANKLPRASIEYLCGPSCHRGRSIRRTYSGKTQLGTMVCLWRLFISLSY